MKKKSLFIHRNLKKEGKYQTELSAQLHDRALISSNYSHNFLIISFNSSSLLKMEALFSGNHTVCFQNCPNKRKEEGIMPLSIWAAITEIPQTGWLKQQTSSLTLLEAVSRSRCWQTWCLESHSLTSPHRVLTWSKEQGSCLGSLL